MSFTHGASAYANMLCRCTVCTAAHTSRMATRRQKLYASVQADGLPSSVKHGYSAYINWGCRCDVCSDANTVHMRAWKASRS